jgi:hypothetical protein
MSATRPANPGELHIVPPLAIPRAPRLPKGPLFAPGVPVSRASEVPVAEVRFDDARAARLYGESFRRQHLYFWTRDEAEAFAAERGGEVVAL